MQHMLHKHGFALTGVVNNLARLPELVFFKDLKNADGLLRRKDDSSRSGHSSAVL